MKHSKAETQSLNIPSTKIKLAVAISDFRVGGAQKVVADILNTIDQSKFEIHLIVFFESPGEETFFNVINSGIKVHQLSFFSFRDIKSWYKTYLLFRKINPNVVWSHLFFSNTLVRVLKPLFKYKVVTVEHNTYVNRTLMEKVVNWILSLLTFKIVAVSKYVADFTAKNEKISSDKFIVINNGVDVYGLRDTLKKEDGECLLKKLGIPSGSIVFLNIGQLIYQKNQVLLIESFANVVKENPQCRLIILGEGILRKELEVLIIKNKLEGKVFLPGIKKNIANYFSASDCFVLTSRFEGFPVVSIEALACSLPIISTPVSGSDEYIQYGKNGWTALPNKDDYTKAMLNFTKLNKNQVNTFVKKSQEMSVTFDIKITTKRYEALFEQAET